MAKRNEREKAVRMRKDGASYSQIRSVLRVSKSSLSLWLRDYPLPKKRLRELQWDNQHRIESFRAKMRAKKEMRLEKVHGSVARDIGKLSKRDLFIAGFFLYWGEGGKTGDCVITVSNTDPAILKCFLEWLTLIKVPMSKAKVYLHIYSDMNPEKEMKFWSKELGIPLKYFRKPYIKKSLRTNISYTQRFIHGTCNVMVYSRDIAEYVMAGYEYIRSQFENTRL